MLGKIEQEEKGVTEDELVGWHQWLNGHELEQTLCDGEGQGSLACYSPWGGKESNTTGQQWVTEQQQINYRAICFSFVKNIMDIFIGTALICRFLWYEYFSKIISSNLKTQHIFPFLCIVFNFFHQCFPVFKVCLSSLWLNSFLGILYFLFNCKWNLSP